MWTQQHLLCEPMRPGRVRDSCGGTNKCDASGQCVSAPQPKFCAGLNFGCSGVFEVEINAIKTACTRYWAPWDGETERQSVGPVYPWVNKHAHGFDFFSCTSDADLYGCGYHDHPNKISARFSQWGGDEGTQMVPNDGCTCAD
jgi:hypothetical protein